jgi:hypothetical protein
MNLPINPDLHKGGVSILTPNSILFEQNIAINYSFSAINFKVQTTKALLFRVKSIWYERNLQFFTTI